jgi:hypothetical protein
MRDLHLQHNAASKKPHILEKLDADVDVAEEKGQEYPLT